MKEIWKDIPNYEGLYEVSNFGRVKSKDRTLLHARCGTQTRKGKLLSAAKSTSGYLRVTLCKNNKTKTFSVHRLVAITFIPNPNNFPQVNHLDEDKTNNCVSNLEWCTQAYNNKYGTREIRSSMSNRNKKSSSKPVVQYSKHGKFINEWPSIREAGRQVGGKSTNISACCKRRMKTAYGYVWRYVE